MITKSKNIGRKNRTGISAIPPGWGLYKITIPFYELTNSTRFIMQSEGGALSIFQRFSDAPKNVIEAGAFQIIFFPTNVKAWRTGNAQAECRYNLASFPIGNQIYTSPQSFVGGCESPNFVDVDIPYLFVINDEGQATVSLRWNYINSSGGTCTNSGGSFLAIALVKEDQFANINTGTVGVFTVEKIG